MQDATTATKTFFHPCRRIVSYFASSARSHTEPRQNPQEDQHGHQLSGQTDNNDIDSNVLGISFPILGTGNP